MRTRRTFLQSLAALSVAPAGLTRARSGGVPRVGILTLTNPNVRQVQDKAFAAAMQALGWREDVNIRYDRVYADGDAARLPRLATELVARKPDLIYAAEASQAAAAARGATTVIPIVGSTLVDPVETGLVQSLAVAAAGLAAGGVALWIMER